MRNCTDKKQHRYQMVVYSGENGVKSAARIFNTSPPVVRKWRDRYKCEGYEGLEDRSRRPKKMPKETSKAEKRKIIRLRKKYKRMGAEQVKRVEELEQSAVTIRKIWREAGVSRRRRRKKYKTKQNLREVKKRYKLYEKACEDTKDLDDIPEYYIQMKKKKLPVVQYTHREVSTGIQFLGFADERSLTHATEFAKYINKHLEKYRLLPQKSIRQTDNGSEYIGSWNAKKESSYTKEIGKITGQRHSTIFPGAKTCQSDVETVHNIIEQDFYEIENFANREDFF
ncbi:MAG: leucine zipper domain-containing protein [Candidatus Omnitrophota bacterium]